MQISHVSNHFLTQQFDTEKENNLVPRTHFLLLDIQMLTQLIKNQYPTLG